MPDRKRRARQAKLRVARKVVELSGYVTSDRLLNPRPRSIQDVPWAPEAITPEWLTLALCSDHPGARVDAIELSRPSKGSTTRCAATVTYNAAGAAAVLPTAVFLKGSKTLKTRLLIGVLNLMASEAQFFTRIRPELDIECPQGYFASHDPRRWRHCIVMEDIVATKGATFCTPTDPLTRAEIEDMLSILGAYHARFWDSPRFGTDLAWLRELRTARSFVEDLTLLVDLEKAAVEGAKRCADLLPRSLVDARQELPAALWKSLEWCGRGPQTLMHGDAHLGQFYRTSGRRMGIFDWQCCGVAGWSFDVSYMLVAALPTEDRRNWERELIAFYLEQLRARGVTPPTLDEAFLAYRRGLVYPLFAWLFALNKPPLQPQMQPRETCVALVERMGAAVADLEVFRALD